MEENRQMIFQGRKLRNRGLQTLKELFLVFDRSSIWRKEQNQGLFNQLLFYKRTSDWGLVDRFGDLSWKRLSFNLERKEKTKLIARFGIQLSWGLQNNMFPPKYIWQVLVCFDTAETSETEKATSRNLKKFFGFCLKLKIVVLNSSTKISFEDFEPVYTKNCEFENRVASF